MSYFENLLEAIDKQLENISLKDLKHVNAELTKKYQYNFYKEALSKEEKLAYIASRMPATYIAIHDVISQLKGHEIKNYIDLGSGPGTSAYAFFPLFNIEKATFVEKDPEFIKLGKTLAENLDFKDRVIWKNQDILSDVDLTGNDLVILSYVMNELPKTSYHKIIDKWIKSDSKHLIVIEPGTKSGFANIHALRHELVSQNKYIIAPCAHCLTCPISKDDWCHFSSRVNRSKTHQFIKEATLNYEDEKYSYIIASKEEISHDQSRIIRTPIKRNGHVILSLCSSEGMIKKEIVTKKDKEKYKIARKSKWGDTF